MCDLSPTTSRADAPRLLPECKADLLPIDSIYYPSAFVVQKFGQNRHDLSESSRQNESIDVRQTSAKRINLFFLSLSLFSSSRREYRVGLMLKTVQRSENPRTRACPRAPGERTKKKKEKRKSISLAAQLSLHFFPRDPSFFIERARGRLRTRVTPR